MSRKSTKNFTEKNIESEESKAARRFEKIEKSFEIASEYNKILPKENFLSEKRATNPDFQ